MANGCYYLFPPTPDMPGTEAPSANSASRREPLPAAAPKSIWHSYQFIECLSNKLSLCSDGNTIWRRIEGAGRCVCGGWDAMAEQHNANVCPSILFDCTILWNYNMCDCVRKAKKLMLCQCPLWSVVWMFSENLSSPLHYITLPTVTVMLADVFWYLHPLTSCNKRPLNGKLLSTLRLSDGNKKEHA